MGRLTAKLVQSAYLVSNGRNEFGDRVYATAGSAVPCLYRDISILNQLSNREEVRLDGQLWFDAGYAPTKGQVYLIGVEYFKIEKVTIARSRLRDNDIEFYKCEVTKQRQVS